ncbi:uncharacterized protein LOC126001570 [Suncus etruscus]|uniref:uncharacterized protein LOC126001570 n=1 Tax=Suncus etruscus TaxID=109475 RepID=UPI002110483A|nr:uncharacterized protein LOC126001570 [Suncus etruscus]
MLSAYGACEQRSYKGPSAVYRELVRYLRAVTSSERIRLQDLHDKVPFYLCKTGDFVGAVEALLAPTSQACCPACRLTPSNFQYYLKMLWTSSVPTGNQLQGADQWVFKGGETPPVPTMLPAGETAQIRQLYVPTGSLVKPYMLVKQALRMLYRNPTLYQDIQSWGFLLALWGSSSALGPNGLTRQALQVPPPSFQTMVLTAGDTILRDLSSQVTPVLPAHLFNSSLCREACLILCIQATVQMLLAQLPQLPPLLSLILDLGENLWALELLLESIQHRAPDMVDMVRQELSDQQCVLLEAWQALGPNYVGELLCLLLGSRVPELQALGVALIHLVARNLNRCPWAKLLDLQRLRVSVHPPGAALKGSGGHVAHIRLTADLQEPTPGNG